MIIVLIIEIGITAITVIMVIILEIVRMPTYGKNSHNGNSTSNSIGSY